MKIAVVHHHDTTSLAALTTSGFVCLEQLASSLGMELPPDPVRLAVHPQLDDLEAMLDKAPALSGPVRCLPPVRRPGKIICMGLNYHQHASETGFSKPSEPMYFAKASSSIVGAEDPIVVPSYIGRVDPEAELAIVIGKTAKSVSAVTAMDHVAGYTCFNDVTARDMQSTDMKAGRPWFRAKSFDSFGPIGPFLVTPDEVTNPHSLSIRLLVNGIVRQHSSSSMMIFNIPSIIEDISQIMTLEPGDVIATGTPEGIAPIYPGDLVTVEVEGIGSLTNPVVGDENT